MNLDLQALTGMVREAPAATLVKRVRAETYAAVRDIRRIIVGLCPGTPR
jgi:hypothetical protein